MVKRILVPLDGSELASSVVPLVADVARGAGAVVRLLHVAPSPDVLVDAQGHVVAYADQEAERLRGEGMDYLQTQEMQFEGIPVASVVRFGDPVHEILEEAEDFGADLVAVSTAGKSGLARTLLGSVAEQVFRKARGPVMLFRQVIVG